MSKKQFSKKTVADEARREVKLLTQTPKLVLDPFGKTNVELKQPFPKELGEYAVIVIATPMTTMQFTIARPIGITDLDETSWVAHRSDQLQGMLARAKDPNQARLDQSRTAMRQELAVAAKLLLKKEEADGKIHFYYPHRNDADRNALLDNARALAKDASSQIRARIESLKEGEGHEKQRLLIELKRASDPVNHLDDATARAEENLRKFFQKPSTTEQVLKKHPQKYRTLAGPYHTIMQVAIPGSVGARLEDVAVKFAKNIAIGTAVLEKTETKFPATVAQAQPKAELAATAPTFVPEARTQSDPSKPPEEEEEEEEPNELGKPKGKGLISKVKGVFS